MTTERLPIPSGKEGWILFFTALLLVLTLAEFASPQQPEPQKALPPISPLVPHVSKVIRVR